MRSEAAGQLPIVTALILVAFSCAAVATAAVPDADGVIYACYKQAGQVRFVDVEAGDACDHNETLVEIEAAWRGPAGPQVYYTEGSDWVQVVVPHPGGASGNRLLLSMEVPAGSYVVEAEIFGEGYPNLLYCRLGANGWSGLVTRRMRFHDDDFGTEPFGNLRLIAAMSLAAPSAIYVGCLAAGEVQGGVTDVDVTILATSVAAVD